jgi:hypothetical protein
VKKLIAAILTVFCGTALYAHSVSGRITDSSTGEPVPGVSVAIEELRDVQITAPDGSFTFSRVPAGSYRLHTAHPLYGNKEITIRVKRRFIIDIELSGKVYSLTPVVSANKEVKTRPGSQSVTSDDIKYMPMTGAGDSLRLLQTLPGAGSSFTMSSVPVIRGLNPIYDKTYVDDIPVDYPYHYFPPVVPLLSSINETIIERVTINKGPYPLTYDDSIGSIIHVKTKEVRQPGVHGKIIVNPLLPLFPTVYCEAAPAADFSILFAGRRTYVDWAADAADIDTDNTFYFQDHYLKLRYNLFSRHRLYLTSMGSDDYISTKDINARTEYHTESLKWQYLVNRKIFLETSFLRSRTNHYYSSGDADAGDTPVAVVFSPIMYRVAQTVTADLSLLSLKTGYEYTVHKDGVSGNIDLSELVDYDIKEQSGDNVSASFPIKGKSFSLFNETGVDLKPVYLNLGVRYKYYGPIKSNSVSYRGIVSYTVKSHELKIYGGGGSYHAQPDMYYYLGESGSNLKEAKSWNGILGFEKKITDSVTGQIETYYTEYEDLFSSGFDAVSSTELRRLSQINPYSRDNSGKGYGAEFFLKGKLGKFEGWAGYSISKTRMSDGVDEYDSDYDQTHIFKAALLTHRGRWTPSAVWHYYTSMPYTPVIGSTSDGGGGFNPQYGSYNSGRYPAHHRLDAKLTYTRGNIRCYAEFWNIYYVYGYDRGDREFKTSKSYLFPVYDKDKPYSSSNPEKQEDIPLAFLWLGVEICF